MYEQKGPSLHQPINASGVGFQMYESLNHYQNTKPNDAALIDAKTKQSINYKELNQISIQLAQTLEEENFGENDCVSIISENDIYFYLPVLAAAYIGIPVAPINFAYKDDELAHVVNISKPKILFISPTCLKAYQTICNKCPSITKIIVNDITNYEKFGITTIKGYIRDSLSDWKPKIVDPKTQIFAILCSSGTTGLPKGVELSHESIQVRMIQAGDPRFCDLLPNETTLGLLPFFHGYGLVTILAEICMGFSIIVMKRFEEEIFLKCIQDYKIRRLFIVPPIIVTLAKSPNVEKYDLSSLNYICSGAAPLDKKIELAVTQRLKLQNIVQGYGLTEAVQAVLLNPLPIRQDKIGSVGVVLPEMTAAVMDFETGRLLGPNQPGEICFKGPCVMKGYLNNPAATAESFIDGWLVTGDIGYYDLDGYFYVIDRRKELIKYKSFQVAPAELEAMLLTHEKVRDAAVIGVADESAGELPMAYIVAQPGMDVKADEIVKFIEERMSNPKRLRGGVRFIPEIPKNPSGKILRKVLRELVKKDELRAKH